MVIACDLRNQGSKEGSVICKFYFSIGQRYTLLKFYSKIKSANLQGAVISINCLISCIGEFHLAAGISSL